MGKKITKIDGGIIDQFMNYSWPGNIRELQNIIERMMNYVATDELTADLIPAEIHQDKQAWEADMGSMESLKDMECQMLKKMLSMKLSKKEIAKKMNIARSSLYRKIKEHNLCLS